MNKELEEYRKERDAITSEIGDFDEEEQSRTRRRSYLRREVMLGFYSQHIPLKCLRRRAALQVFLHQTI